MKMYKCPYKQCKFNNEVSEDIAIKHKGRYYHKECLKESQEKKEIKELFLENINEYEVIPKLVRTINNIIHNKNVSSEYLLYALKYVIKNKKPLNYAGGLYYIIGNKDIQKSYKKEKADKIARKVKQEIDKVENIQDIDFNKDIDIKTNINKPDFINII